MLGFGYQNVSKITLFLFLILGFYQDMKKFLFNNSQSMLLKFMHMRNLPPLHVTLKMEGCGKE